MWGVSESRTPKCRGHGRGVWTSGWRGTGADPLLRWGLKGGSGDRGTEHSLQSLALNLAPYGNEG